MIRCFEELSMNAWPSLQTRLYDGWVLRFADGYTKRANCINPLYNSTISLDKKIDYCEKEYASRDIPAVFKITPESMPAVIDTRLEKRGYIRDDEVSLRILPMNEYICLEPQGITVDSRFSEEWLAAFFSCSGITYEGDRLTIRRILANILGEVICVAKLFDGRIVGCGYGARERDYVGIFNMVVDTHFRGNGYGKDIMDGILGAAGRGNARTAYLQVLTGNVPAERLYHKMGFKEIYRYWYRKPGKINIVCR